MAASRARISAIAVCAAAAVALLSALGHPGQDYRHSDFFQFWAAPRIILEGGDPYDPVAWSAMYAREARAPVATPPPPGRHIYPLYSAVPLLPFAALPIDVAAALWLVAQLAVVALSLRALARRFGLGRREAMLLFGFAAAFEPLWLLVGGGNMTGFVLGLVVAALAAPRAVAAGAAIGLLALKPTDVLIAVPATIAAARAERRLPMVVSAVVTAALLLAVTLPFGPSWIGEFAAAAGDRLVTTGSNATVWTIDRALPGSAAVTAILAVAALAALAVWWRARPRPAPTLVAGAVAVSLFVAPHGWSYDQLLLLVTLAAVLAEGARLDDARRVAVAGTAAAVFALFPWALYALAFRRGSEEWSALTPLLAFALLVGSASWADRRARATPQLTRRQEQSGLA